MILLLDHRDSFTHNLAQLLGSLEEVRVLPAARVAPEDLEVLAPRGIVLSPGPGGPGDVPRTLELVRAAAGRIPLLGVCLGHQALAAAFGASVGRAPKPLHGKTSPVRHRGRGILAGLPDPFRAVRYHSLAVDPATLPPELEVTARAEDGVVMGLQHRTWPVFGVQFHPESILAEGGRRLLENFCRCTGKEGTGR